MVCTDLIVKSESTYNRDGRFNSSSCVGDLLFFFPPRLPKTIAVNPLHSLRWISLSTTGSEIIDV